MYVHSPQLPMATDTIALPALVEKRQEAICTPAFGAVFEDFLTGIARSPNAGTHSQTS